MDPKQLRILVALTTFLEAINPDNEDPATGLPYAFDLRGKVFRGKSLLTVDDAEDSLSILEVPRQDIFSAVGEGAIRNDAWALVLQGWPADDPDHPSDSAYRLKAACEQRLWRIIAQKPNGRGPVFEDDYMLGRELSSFQFAPGVVRPPEDAASRLAMFYMPLVLGVKVNVGNPFD